MNPKKLADKQASNHGISSLKFQILREFLILGYNVLLSDVDIVTLQDPFKHLHRDADVESMSDGWEDFRAYGYDDVDDDATMGWSRYSHSFRIWHYNSGLFYLRASDRTIELMDRITDRLAREQAWDQGGAGGGPAVIALCNDVTSGLGPQALLLVSLDSELTSCL